MDYEHDIVTRAAVEALPRWARDILAPVRATLIRQYSHGLDRAAGDAALHRYVAFHRDGLPLHYLPDGDTLEQNYDRVYGGAVFYFRSASRSFTAGRVADGALFAAMLCHFLQDAGYVQHGLDSPCGFKEPGSCTPFAKLLQLFPPPPGREHENAAMVYKVIMSKSAAVRSVLERTSISGYAPVLLGLTPEEAAFRLYRRYWDLLSGVRGFMPAFFSAVYARDEQEYIRICRDLIAGAARVSADVLYTALCLAGREPRPAEMKRLARVRVEDLVPLTRPNYSCTLAYSDCPLVRDGNLGPGLRRRRLALLIRRGRTPRRRYFRHGLGTGMGWREPETAPDRNSCDYALRYKVPPGVYKRFTVTCGLNAGLPQAGRISLEVRWNGRLRGATPVMEKPGPAAEICVDARSGGTLELVARNRKRDPLDPPFPQVNIVWAEPLLSK